MNFKKKNAANAPAPNQAQQAARRRSLRSGAYASVLAVVVLVLVILLNLVVGAVPTKFTQFDISTGKMFTLSDTTKTMLQELNTDVTAYYLAETGNEDSNITRILDRYAGESSHFTWQQRDPALYPTFAQQYDAQNASSSSVILVCGDNHTVVDYNDMYTADYSSYYTTGSYTMSFSAENALSSGIAKVTRENSYVLYQLTGHGESSLESDFTETLDNSGVTMPADHRYSARRCRSPADQRPAGGPFHPGCRCHQDLSGKRRPPVCDHRSDGEHPQPGCPAGRVRHDPPGRPCD